MAHPETKLLSDRDQINIFSIQKYYSGFNLLYFFKRKFLFEKGNKCTLKNTIISKYLLLKTELTFFSTYFS